MRKKKLLLPGILLIAGFLLFAAGQGRIVYQVDTERCSGCALCYESEVCPTGAIDFAGGKAVIDPDLCIGCRLCLDKCFFSAIKQVQLPIDPASQENTPSVNPADAVKQEALPKVTPNRYQVDNELCIGCGLCAIECPTQAISIVDLVAVIDQELCIGCGICEETCRRVVNAISLQTEAPEESP